MAQEVSGALKGIFTTKSAKGTKGMTRGRFPWEREVPLRMPGTRPPGPRSPSSASHAILKRRSVSGNDAMATKSTKSTRSTKHQLVREWTYDAIQRRNDLAQRRKDAEKKGGKSPSDA